jgi:phytoene dehydrogenase-like protein
MSNATIFGAGHNGLSAAVVLARADLTHTVFKRNVQIGGASSSAETTLANFRQDLGSSVYPMGVASPFFRFLPSRLPWIKPTAPCAHPLDDGTAVMVEHSIEDTVDNLDQCDRRRYRSVLEGFVSKFNALCDEILGLLWHIPRCRLPLARFASVALKSAVHLARSQFRGKRAQALFAGAATHSLLPLAAPGSAATALTFLVARHACGWPILRGGAQTLPDSLAAYIAEMGGRIQTNNEVTELPEADLVLASVTPRQLLCIAAARLTAHYRKQLERFRYGPGAFKINYALSAPIPWTASECSRTATLEGRWRRSSIRSERSHLLSRSFSWVKHPSSIRVGHPRASTLPGRIATCPMAAQRTIRKRSNARLALSLPSSPIAFSPDLSLWLPDSNSGIQI